MVNAARGGDNVGKLGLYLTQGMDLLTHESLSKQLTILEDTHKLPKGAGYALVVRSIQTETKPKVYISIEDVSKIGSLANIIYTTVMGKDEMLSLKLRHNKKVYRTLEPLIYTFLTYHFSEVFSYGKQLYVIYNHMSHQLLTKVTEDTLAHKLNSTYPDRVFEVQGVKDKNRVSFNVVVWEDETKTLLGTSTLRYTLAGQVIYTYDVGVRTKQNVIEPTGVGGKLLALDEFEQLAIDYYVTLFGKYR